MASTCLFELILMVQLDSVPVQAPAQPRKRESSFAVVAVKVTETSFAKAAEQVDPQVTPIGLLDTLPSPLPDFCIVKVWVCIGRLMVRLMPSLAVTRAPFLSQLR